MIKNVSMGKEIALILEHKPGELNKIVAFMADRGISIEAICSYGTPGEGKAKLMIVPDDVRRAVDVLLLKTDDPVEEHDVIIIDIENAPGALLSLTKILSQKDINIFHICGVASIGDAPIKVILSTADNERAYAALKGSVTV